MGLIDARGDDLLIGGVPAKELAERYGTPLYVYDLDTILQDLERLRTAFPRGTGIFYSVKANPLLSLLEFFRENGCGAEVASGGELHAALKAGFEPGKILFAGPGKSREEHELAVGKGIFSIHVESLGEIERLGHLAGKRTVRAGIRINASVNIKGARMRMGGGSHPFGIDEEKAGKAV